MRKFLNGSLAAYADLEERAKAVAYITFRDEDLPPGCDPPKGRVGVKVDPTTNASVLYVEMGIRYYGQEASIRAWLDAGELAFPTFAELQAWLTSDLKRAFETPVDVPTSTAGTHHAAVNGAADRPRAFEQSVAPSSPEPIPENDRPEKPPGALALGGNLSDASTTEPVLGRLVELLVRQVAAKHGVEVCGVEPALSAHLIERIRSDGGGASPDRVVEEVLAGPLSLAALQGHASVTVQAGPPVACTPTNHNHD
jgi:hypothetical protein